MSARPSKQAKKFINPEVFPLITMSLIILPIILAIIISFIYYLSNRYNITHKEWNKRIVSFSAGVSIIYVLLELFPTFTEGALPINKLLFISIPFGFIAHHIIEKEIYKHNHKHELIKMLSLEEYIFSFVYHLIIGTVLVTFTKTSLVQGVLFFVPVALYTFLSTLSTSPHPTKTKTVLLSSATLIGVLIALLLINFVPFWMELLLMGLAIGVLLFSVIRHHIPFGRKGRLGYFTIGFIFYSFLIIISWYL